MTRTLTSYRLPATNEKGREHNLFFKVETGGEYGGDYRCSIGREDAPHTFIVEAGRAEQVVSFCRGLEEEGWQQI